MTEQDSIHSTINKFASDGLISCYQIQPCNEKKCKPVFIGKYKTIPTYTHKIVKYNNYKLHIITYLLSDDEVKKNIYKILGIVIFKDDNEQSDHGFDLSYISDNDKYQLIYSNHKSNIIDIVEQLDKLPDGNIIDYVLNRFFILSVKKIIKI